jgi:cyclopropane-fatty-acyl-phospholipid synthase
LESSKNLKCSCFKICRIDFSVRLVQARIDKNHEVLEIGCGWGSLAIEVVKRTGCKYTGITLSEEQLKYAEMNVKEAGLQVLT